MRRLARLTGGDERRLAFGARPAPPDDPLRLVADVTRLHREVGFASDGDLDAALAETVAWWRPRVGERIA